MRTTGTKIAVSVQPPEKPDHLDQLEIRDRQADHDVIS
jgi:hypothetical protein